MHSLQPKQTKLKPEEVDKLIKTLNISLAQLPKIKITDPTLTDNYKISDVIQIERVTEGKVSLYYRVVAV